MRLHRFFVEEKLSRKNEIRISDERLLHQLRDVFRLKKGDEAIFFDGEGLDITFRIKMISKKEGTFVKEKEERSIMPKKNITLLMSLIKKDNFEMVLQKCTELGVSRFVPILAERSEKKNIDMERAKRIIKEASEQCGRGDIPGLREVMSLEKALQEFDNILVFDLRGESLPASEFVSLQANQLASSPAILIGSEGGWSDRELALFKDKNIPIYSLGELTLRAETAAIVTSSLALF